jgi:hypothetical protein
VSHTRWSYEGARIHLATFAIAKQAIFSLAAGFARVESHVLIVQGDFEWCLWCLVAGCFGRETVYAVVLGCGGLLLLVDRVLLVGSRGEHNRRAVCGCVVKKARAKLGTR